MESRCRRPGGVDPQLGAIVVKACAPDPGMRYQTAQEFQDALSYWDTWKGQQSRSNFYGENTSEGTQKMWGVSGESPMQRASQVQGNGGSSGRDGSQRTTDSFEKQSENGYPVQKKKGSVQRLQLIILQRLSRNW